MDDYRTIDGNHAKEIIGYCKSHKGYLTEKQLRVHRCLRRQCTGLERIDCKFWQDRQEKKDAQKRRKQADSR